MASILDTFNQRYRVTFYERTDPLNRIVAWLGDTPPTPSAGGGGYNAIALPFRSAVSVWQGRGNLLVMDVPIMLYQDEPQVIAPQGPPRGQSGFVTAGRGVIYNQSSPPSRPMSTADQIGRLMRMWRPDDDTEPPPIIKLTGPGTAVPFQNLPWWVSDFAWGTVIGDENANRVMQQLVIQVTEYRADEELQTIHAKTPAANKRQRSYVVRHGDTLTSIARKYHLRNGWRQLASAQHPPINDPRQIRVGQRLVIPPAG